MKRKITLVLVLLLSWCTIIHAQTTVSGRVSDQKGAPLPGVSVKVKGSATGASTNTDGNYSVSVPANATLEFSFIGYLKQEIAVGNRTTINVTLQEDVTSLSEVVVVGYGTQRKSLVTGAISSVKAEDLKAVSSSRIDQALQGRTAGVTVLPNSGSPGAGISVRIRGTGSNRSSEPLYVIDGMRAGGIEYLDPSEIASIEILKDAASSAIYGAEGANGVVIITTKTGTPNTSEVSYTAQFGTQSLNTQMTMMNAQQYQQYLQEAAVPGAPTAAEASAVGAGTNWSDVLFDNAPQMHHTLTMSTGTDKSNFLIGATYFTQKGIAGGEKSKFDRYTLRLNSDHKIKPWLNVGERVSYAHFINRGIGENNEFGSVVGSAIALDPITPVIYSGALPAHAASALAAGQPLVRDANGNYYGISNFVRGEYGNPLARLAILNTQNTQNKVVGNAYVDVTPIEGLKITSRFGIDAAFQRGHNWNPTFWFSSESLNTIANGGDFQNNWLSWNWENFATYTRAFGDHNLSVLGGTSAQRFMYNGLNGSYSGLFKEEEKFSYPDYVPDNLDRIGGQFNDSKILSYYGRLTYDFDNKYLFSATVRRDGASKLPPENKWGTFPSFSAGWILSNESFYSPGISNIINYFKLRGSWGQNGSLSNIGIGDWQAAISSAGIRYPDAQGNYVVGAAPSNLENSELKWETSEQIDIGADLNLFNNRASFTVDWFKKTTKDLLTPGVPPLFVGNVLPIVNGGNVENKGWEFEASYRNSSTRAFKWELSGNMTFLKNNVTFLNPNVNEIGGAGVGTGWTATVFQQNYPIWYFRGYKTNGIFQNSAQISSYMSSTGITGYTPKPGDPIVVDVNGDKQITAADQTYIGDPHPNFMYGARLSMNYKGFDFMVFLQGQTGNQVLMGFNRNDRPTANKPEFFYTNRWTGDGSTNEWFAANTTNNFVYNSDLMVFDGSFARIRQLQLGYTLPNSLSNKIKVRNARLYVSLDDYFTFTDYPGFDPEGGNWGGNSLGIDRGVYPVPRKAIFGLSFSF